MRIGFDAKRLFLNERGLGNYSRNLFSGLVRYQPSNEYFLYTPKLSHRFVSTDLTEASNVHVISPNGWAKSAGSLWRSFGLGSTASSDDLDIFHGLSHEIPFDFKKVNSKIVVTVHDLIFVKHPEFYKPVDRWLYYKKLKFALNYADVIVAISEQTRDDILTEFNIEEHRVKVIYQSCNEVFYDKRPTEDLSRVRAKGQLPSQYLLFVGALNENKNILVILKAMRALGEQLTLPLVIVGKGKEYRKQLEAYAKNNGLNNRIHFVNDYFDPDPYELSCVYQMASVFILPSYYEGFGIPILEARFSDIPVIASNSSCLHEAGGLHSSYFDPSDPDELSSHLLSAVSASGSLTIERPELFKLESITQQLIDLYKSLL